MKTYKKLIIEFEDREGRKPFAYELCPRFERCQINKCPLYPDYLKLRNDSSDPSQKGKKEKCATKDRRMRIAIAFDLENKGMKTREISAAKNKIKLDIPSENSKQYPISHQRDTAQKSQREKKTNGHLNTHINNKSKEVKNENI